MVHYIRFLSMPKFIAADNGASRKILAVLTVTTDLGETFFPDEIELIVRLVNTQKPKVVLDFWPVIWNKNARVVKLNVRHMISNPTLMMRLHVSTRETDELLAEGCQPPKVLDAWTSSFRLDALAYTEDLIERRMRLTNDTCVKIWEETGESIARHIW
jgi:hypothetical protein